MPRSATLAVLLALVATPVRGATNASESEILFVRDGHLWRGATSGKGQATDLLSLPKSKPLSMQLSRSGKTLLLQTDSDWLWITITKSEAKVLKRLNCKSAQLTRSGKCVVCSDDNAKVTIHERPPKAPFKVMGQHKQVAFRGGQMVFTNTKGLWAWTPGTNRRKRLATHHPNKDLLVSPDGRRAAGVYTEATGDATYGFRLDGKGARRRLFGNARPIAWSANSQWLVVQSDEAACGLRATGGEYKCWDGYQAVALSADGSEVYLSKESDGVEDLYRTPMTGTRPVSPQKIWSKTDGPAAAPLPLIGAPKLAR